MKIEQIKISGINSPTGYLIETPILSWKVIGAAGKNSSLTEIWVSDAADYNSILFHTAGDKLDWTGTSLELVLCSRTTYYVKIKVTDENGETAIGETCFETGKNGEEWVGSWITTESSDTYHPIFKKSFELSDVKSGRLYIAGLGLYEAYLNGEKIGNEFLTPYLNDYSEYIQTQTFDISDLLKENNTLEVYLGKGWYSGPFGMARQCQYNDFRLIAEMHFKQNNGEEIVIGTDDTWEYSNSPVLSSGIYDGEEWDDTLTSKEWKKACYVDSNSTNSKITETGSLTDRYSLPVVKKMVLPVVDVIHTPAGELVLDFGQNMAGWVVFRNTFPEGTKIRLEFGEVLQQGNFYNGNYKTATNGFSYISNGENKLVRPHFTYFGFRYVKLSGVSDINPDDFEAWVLYSDLDTTGFIHTDNEKLNRLYANCVWGQKSNFLDIPSDCPQRDERLAWTGDAEIFAPTASYNMYTSAFYRKFMWMLRTSQLHRDGGIPSYLPEGFILCENSAGWGDAAVIIPSVMWDFYRDKEALKSAFPMMKDWVDYVGRQIEKTSGNKYGLWTDGFQFGDWLALDGFSENEFKGSTPDVYMASMYYYNSLKLVTKAAGILEDSSSEKNYQQLTESQKKCLLDNYFTPTGHLCINTQAAYIMAIQFDVYRDFQILVDDFVSQLRRDKFKIRCGFTGGPVLCQALAKCGRADLAYHFLLNESYPGWMYAVNLGATTVWERWNSILPDGSINPMGMNSLNHYSYGSVCEFLYKYMAGINPGNDGYKNAIIKPLISPYIKNVNASYDSIAGKYEVSYHLQDDGKITISVVVPYGCTASLTLPGCSSEIVLEAGTYTNTYLPEDNVLMLFTPEAFLSDVWKNPEAKELVMSNLEMAGMFRSPENDFRQVKDLFELIPMGASPEKIGEVIGRLSMY